MNVYSDYTISVFGPHVTISYSHRYFRHREYLSEFKLALNGNFLRPGKFARPEISE
jgi:hypothetical protein